VRRGEGKNGNVEEGGDAHANTESKQGVGVRGIRFLPGFALAEEATAAFEISSTGFLLVGFALSKIGGDLKFAIAGRATHGAAGEFGFDLEVGLAAGAGDYHRLIMS
jgi:hypothetical protein